MQHHETIESPIARPTRQIYSDYTEHDFLVWKTLFERQMNILRPNVSEAYLEAIRNVQFSSDRIPDFAELEQILKPQTGWKLTVVPNISPAPEFFSFLSKKQFTATCWLRNMDQLDYLEEPDMFHDVFGHAPLLSNQAYVDFFKGMSDIALRHLHEPEKIELLGRLYWFTIEFGMIREQGKLKIYGAGIISSMGETLHCLSEKTEHLPFDVQVLMNTPYRTDILQEKYFVIDSFEQLYHSLPEIEQLIENYSEDKSN
ncbi:MAG TPA: phenylalanine 4-monooxygenase [Chitinophagaceae bacterium]|nr:phenylalanine 4-monooxygenase [Chitinophagaceae bacterium]